MVNELLGVTYVAGGLSMKRPGPPKGVISLLREVVEERRVQLECLHPFRAELEVLQHVDQPIPVDEFDRWRSNGWLGLIGDRGLDSCAPWRTLPIAHRSHNVQDKPFLSPSEIASELAVS